MWLKKVKQRGQVLVLYALLMPIFILVIGAGLDLGWYYLNVSRLQNAADAAALAGARALVAKDRDFNNYYVVRLVSNYLPENYYNYEDVYKNTFGNVNTGKLNYFKTADEVKDTLRAGRDSAEEYVRKNLSDDKEVTVSSDYKKLSATDGWSSEKDSAVKGTVDLKYYQTEGKNDKYYPPLYYVVNLHEKIRHLFLPGWFEDMDAPVRAVVLLRPHDKGILDPLRMYDTNEMIDNWEEQKQFSPGRGGKWNHYMAGTTSDTTGIKYANNNPYRTESVVVKPTSRSDDKSTDKKSDGQPTKANGDNFYLESEVDSINIDYQADVRVKSNQMFTTDWDIVMGAASTLSNFDKYYHVDSTYSWGLGNGEDKRILFTVDFEQSFEMRNPLEQADVLWTRIESDPIKKQAGVTVYNSVRQNTLIFSSDNT